MASYVNLWHNRRDPKYGPKSYEASVNPAEYRGYLIFQRIEGSVWDVVKDGVCVAQRAGPNGARQAVDMMLESEPGQLAKQ